MHLRSVSFALVLLSTAGLCHAQLPDAFNSILTTISGFVCSIGFLEGFLRQVFGWCPLPVPVEETEIPIQDLGPVTYPYLELTSPTNKNGFVPSNSEVCVEIFNQDFDSFSLTINGNPTNPIFQGTVACVDALLQDGPNLIEATDTGDLQISTVLQSGSSSVTINLFDETSAVFLTETTVVAQLSDDELITVTGSTCKCPGMHPYALPQRFSFDKLLDLLSLKMFQKGLFSTRPSARAANLARQVAIPR